MKIAIIGAGFTGLAAAFDLSKQKNEVIVFEKDLIPGGLAMGYKEKMWNWTLEKHYHHWFTNDKSILNLAKEINYKVIIKRPKTSILVKNKIYQFDSPITILRFPFLSFWEKIRMSTILGLLKLNPFWQHLEKYKACDILPKIMGKKSYQMIWEPLFINKFGKYTNNISLAWFWARIKKRTPSLAYPNGGFLDFANAMVKNIIKIGGIFYFASEVVKIEEKNERLLLKYKLQNGKEISDIFDKIIVTTPAFTFIEIAPQLPKKYVNKLNLLKSLGATNLVIRLKKPFFNDDTYWLNVCDNNAPVMAIVEHTNFMDKKYYSNEHIVYLGNYKSLENNYFHMSKEQMLEKFNPFLKKINKDYKKNIIGYELFKSPFAQPIIPVSYSKIIPPLKTPLKNVFLANIQQVYPWDRGTNYAVELGQRVAWLIKTNG